jgi:hypothetical protein
MKILFLAGVIWGATAALLPAADTAYAALRVFGKKEGEQALHRVVELRAKGGTPQPATWTITIDDPRARGGVREIEVRGGRMSGERTPVGRDFGAPMNFNQLNLDSDGAFTVANQEAEKRGVPFDRIDYTLGSGAGGVPIWSVALHEQKGGRVGTLKIAADSGAVVDQDFSNDRRYADDRAYVETDRRRDPEYRGEGGGLRGEAGAFLDRIGRHFQKRGRQLSNFFTGKER